MRLVIDLQGCQTGSRFRGIGRYCQGLTQAMLAEAGDHEILLALNGAAPERVEAVRRDFAGHLPLEQIRAWRGPHPGNWIPGDEDWRHRPAEAIRDYFLANLGADVVHVSSLIEGILGDAVTSIGLSGEQPPTGTMLYDLTLLRRSDHYLADRRTRRWYQDKLQHMRRARRCLAISDYSRQDGIDLLGLRPEHVVNISAAADARFAPRRLAPEEAEAIRRSHGLDRPFVLYFGGLDPHKNVERLIEAFGLLPAEQRSAYQLAVVGPFASDAQRAAFDALVARCGLSAAEIRFLGYVDDAQLLGLLHACTLSVYCSLREGFGLPVLEAMASGAAAICSDNSSLPEVVGRADAMFDATRARSIAERLQQALSDAGFRADLRAHGLQRARQFSWRASARKALDVYEHLHAEETARRRDRLSLPVRLPRPPRLAWLADWPLSPMRRLALADLAETYAIDLFVDPLVAAREVLAAGLSVVDIALFAECVADYDRVVIDRAAAGRWLRLHPAVVVRPAGASAEIDATSRLALLGVIDAPAETGAEPTLEAAAAWARRAAQAIEAGHCDAASPLALTRVLARLIPPTRDDVYDEAVAEAIAANRPPSGPPRLLLDVSSQAMGEPGSGISRVVSRLVQALTAAPPAGFAVEPVRFAPDSQRLVHARRFAAGLAGLAGAADLAEPEVELRVGDRFIGVDLNYGLAAQAGLLRRLRELGGEAIAVVYDLLPIQRPDWFHEHSDRAHAAWFDAVSRWDGLMCISRSVADEVEAHLRELRPDGPFPRVGWFHLGSDLPQPAVGGPLPALGQRPSLMQVSILWARKGHEQALNAMELLWAAGVDVNYVIVGRKGWGLDHFIARIRGHAEWNRRLHWFDGPDDALLARLYATVDGVILPSEGEGFGLPLVEAIHHGRPVLCRDLPVFREIVGDGAHFFSGLDAEALAAALKDWLGELKAGTARRPTDISLLSWTESAQQFLREIGFP